MTPTLHRLLDAHLPADADEARSLDEMRRLLPHLAQPFSRHQSEAREETGCEVRLYDPTPTLLDVDVHHIPARGDEPAHHHLDLRFLMVAEDPQRLKLNAEESSAVGWFGFDEAIALVDDDALQRLIRKGRQSVEGLRTR